MRFLARIPIPGRRKGSVTATQMTWASRSLSKSMSRAGLFFRKQLWAWPITAVVVLSLAGFIARAAIESTMKANIESALTTLVGMEASMLERYFDTQKANAETLVTDFQIRQTAYPLVDPVRYGQEAADPANPVPADPQVLRERFKQELAPALVSQNYAGFFLADKEKNIVAASTSALIGEEEIPEFAHFLDEALDGKTVVCPPFPSVLLMRTPSGRLQMGQPTMYVATPIRDETFQVIGVLALQLRPEEDFTEILQLGRIGESGETYAFNAEGLMVSNSRFDEQLILLGILPDREDVASILSVMVRDPGGDMSKGYRPSQRRHSMPLTRMAKAAAAGNSGVDVEGYRDYRGVSVVGAWEWLPEYELGIATEVDTAQAFRPLVLLQRVFWTLYTMLVLSSVAIFVFTVLVSRARRYAQKAVVEAKQLGQYTLDEKLGEGAIGVVYKGHHAMLRRPTAIKMLNLDKVDDASLARFENEVQLTCQLTHPNTISIFDYGRTPEDVFYYAMEYVEGINLQHLVMQHGVQPPSRVIHILKQICGSLFEAHSQGLVHRDIKPANIMLCERGGVADFVKVLDFGLVKGVEEDASGGRGEGLTGTPLYMSPEAIQTPLSVDGRTDIYAIGAVAYYLLTGEPVFQAASVVELCQKHLEEAPPAVSDRAPQPVSSQLEYAVMACLEKSRAKRPQTARDLASLLNKCPEATEWSAEDRDAWWSRYMRGATAQTALSSSSSPAPPSQVPDGLDQTMDF